MVNGIKLEVLNSEAYGSSYEPKKDVEFEDCFKQAAEVAFEGGCWASHRDTRKVLGIFILIIARVKVLGTPCN